MTQSRVFLALILVTVLAACGPATVRTQPTDSAQPAGGMGAGMGQMMNTLLAELVETGKVSQEQVGVFDDIHDRLVEAGLMQ